MLRIATALGPADLWLIHANSKSTVLLLDIQLLIKNAQEYIVVIGKSGRVYLLNKSPNLPLFNLVLLRLLGGNSIKSVYQIL